MLASAVAITHLAHAADLISAPAGIVSADGAVSPQGVGLHLKPVPVAVECTERSGCDAGQFCQVRGFEHFCAPARTNGSLCASSYECLSNSCSGNLCQAKATESVTEVRSGRAIPAWGLGIEVGGKSMVATLQGQHRLTEWLILEAGAVALWGTNGNRTDGIVGAQSGTRLELPWSFPLRPFVGGGAGFAVTRSSSGAWVSARAGASYYFGSYKETGITPLITVDVNAMYLTGSILPSGHDPHIQMWPGIAVSALFAR